VESDLITKLGEGFSGIVMLLRKRMEKDGVKKST
jgi:hypothetical protein